MIQQLRQQQKESVAAAKKERLRKSSDSLSTGQLREQSVEYQPDYTLDKSYGELEVEDIVNRYSEHLPLDVVVSRGIYGMEEKYSLATSDRSG